MQQPASMLVSPMSDPPPNTRIGRPTLAFHEAGCIILAEEAIIKLIRCGTDSISTTGRTCCLRPVSFEILRANISLVLTISTVFISYPHLAEGRIHSLFIFLISLTSNAFLLCFNAILCSLARNLQNKHAFRRVSAK